MSLILPKLIVWCDTMVIKGEEEWEVEKIINKRRVRRRDKYLV